MRVREPLEAVGRRAEVDESAAGQRGSGRRPSSGSSATPGVRVARPRDRRARASSGRDDQRSTGGPTVRLPLRRLVAPHDGCRIMAEPLVTDGRCLSGALESPGSMKARQPAHDPRVGTVPRPGSIGGEDRRARGAISRCARPRPAPGDGSPASPELLRERILVLDGATGTLIQEHSSSEADFRGYAFADHPRDLGARTTS